MSFPDPPPPPNTFTSLPSSGGYWHPFLMESDQSDLISQFDMPQPFKRPRNSDQPPNFAPFPPMTPRVNPPNVSGSKGTGHIFYKTRICAKFTEGTCRNGETCSFAHGAEDLREPPPNWQELIREKDRGTFNRQGDDQRMRHGMKICKKYYNGEECPYGDKCNFLHERRAPFPPRFKADVPTQRESAVINIGTTGFDQTKQVNGNLDAYQTKTVMWKTKICSKWEIGQCPFGERCHYAHGMSDLKLSDTRVEAEPVINSGSVPANPLSSFVQSMAPAKLAIGAAINEDGYDKKALKWKLSRKINRIYGDWLDDGSPPHCSPDNEGI